MKRITHVFFFWLPLAVAITGVCGLIMATVQQNYRQSFNDPQIQMAEDGAYALAHGSVPASLVPRGSALIDLGASLSPWIAVYDSTGMLLESSGVLGGTPPQLPKGVFDMNTWRGSAEYRVPITTAPDETRFTWESKGGVRSAVVLVYVPEIRQYVASGRNMRELENRVQALSWMVGIAWVVIMLATLATVAFAGYVKR